ncbi:inner membrane protein YccS [Enterobacter cancerogenus]|uniref:Inner membrane protein YccS n=1 Tax=Enterobacter cancerogenus TaxID=69218 RepID=A0A484XBQ4_9ENTR|nr:inner membrane protein YccS [Enterobacter cancerogenus]
MVAGALADLDDRLTGRLRNLVITLICFFIASASVELLFPWPWLFALGLTLSTSGFILLGGLGQRYATIAFGALLIAIYTMLGVSLYDQWYQQPVLLLLRRNLVQPADVDRASDFSRAGVAGQPGAEL